MANVPASIEAEEALLGSILLYPQTQTLVFDEALQISDFFDEKHKKALEDNNADVVAVSKYLPSYNGDNSHSITSISVEQPTAIHIFSNILDIEAVSLKGVSKMIPLQVRIILCFVLGQPTLMKVEYYLFVTIS